GEPAAAGGEGSGGANLIGYGTSEPKTRASQERSFGRKTTASAAAEPSLTSTVSAPTSAVSGPPSAQQVSPGSSPPVRTPAPDHGISAKRLPGSGAGGVVTRADVLAAIESDATVSPHVPAGTSATSTTGPGTASAGLPAPAAGPAGRPAAGPAGDRD